MKTCDAPDNKPENAYLVQEISFVDEALDWRQWPAAILVSDLVEPFDIRYDLGRKGGKLVLRKVLNYRFLRKNTIVKVGYMRRLGWLVGAGGEPKETALIWFEGVLESVKHRQASPAAARGFWTPHYSKNWVKRVLDKLLIQKSPHWVPIITGK